MTFCWDFLLCGCFGCCQQKEAKKEAALRTVQDTSAYQGPRIFTLKELTAATKEFSAEELLGRGAFGSVYKGTLGDGSVVAVKQIAQDSHQDEREFLAEVSIISRIRHRNLVQLQGWCHEKGSLLLVYDYMPNGSLDKLLEGRGGGAVAKDAPATGGGLLPWDVRQKILKGVAAALAYLHDDCQQCVLHRDVKPSNVLLDAKFNPHLADFGLARLIDHRTENVQTTIIAGTRGYLAPELVQVGKVSTKSDVFSFGVLALEVVCGRRPLDRNLPDQYHIGLVDCAWRAHESNALLSLVDPRLGNGYDANKLTNIMKIGLFCCHPDPEARPPMSFVRQYFISEVPLPPLPSSKPLVTYSLGPKSPSKPAAAQQQALAAPEPKLAIEGPPAGKALAIEGPPEPPEAIANEAQAPHMVHESLATEAPPPTTETSGSSSNHINPSRGNSQDSSLQSSQKFLQSSSA
jgi:interleukin-1 receptor-associated kinase 1